jgi:hypothetical protein
MMKKASHSFQELKVQQDHDGIEVPYLGVVRLSHLVARLDEVDRFGFGSRSFAKTGHNIKIKRAENEAEERALTLLPYY